MMPRYQRTSRLSYDLRSLLLIYISALALAGCASQQAATSAAPDAGSPAPAATEVIPRATAQIMPSSTTLATETLAIPTVLATKTQMVPTVLPATLVPSEAPTAARDAIDDTPQLTDAHAPATPEPSPVNQVVPDSAPVRVVIGAIDLDRKLISVGLDKQRVPVVPKHDIGWYNLSAKPGQGENVVMWGHVLRFKNAPNIPAPFARLKEVGVGQRITVYTADGQSHVYIVEKQVWVTPDQVEYILPQGSERLTLVSCIGDKVIVNGSVEMTNRLVTIALPEA